MTGSLPVGALALLPPMAALLTARSVVAVGGAIVVAVGVAAAFTYEFEALQRGLDLLPVAPAAHLAAARLDPQQLRDPGGAFLLDGRPLRAPVAPRTGGVPPARPAPPRLVPHLGSVAGGGVLGGRPARPAGRSRQPVGSRPEALAPAMLRRRRVVQAVGAPVAVQGHRRRQPRSLLGGPSGPGHRSVRSIERVT
jgi:hypothetical protein